MPRRSKMEDHPDFKLIIEALINKRMSNKEAAKRLGSTEPNLSQYMGRHYPKHKPKRKQKDSLKIKDPQAVISSKDGEPSLTIQLEETDSNLEWGTVAWKKMLQNIITTLLTEPDLNINQQIKLIRAAADILKFQFSHTVPDIPRETVHIDDEMAKELVDEVIKDHESWCPYRNEFIKRKDRSQSKSRLELTKPSLME